MREMLSGYSINTAQAYPIRDGRLCSIRGLTYSKCSVKVALLADA